MSGSTLYRVVVILGSLLLGVWILLPNFVGTTAEQELSAKIGDGGAEAPETGLAAWLPSTRINLGLDLQGGIDLTLQVGVDEAVLSSVARDVQGVQGIAEREGLKLQDVRKARGEPMLEVRLAEGTTLEELRAALSGRMPGYAYASTLTDDAGAEWHRFEVTEDERARIADSSVEQAVETLRSRIDATGVKEPTIVRKGVDQINVQLPGAVDLQEATRALGTTAVLEFLLVDEDFQPAALERALEAARSELPPEQYADDRTLSEWLVDTGRIGRNNLVLWEYEPNEEGVVERSVPYVLKDQVLLTGDDVNDAMIGMDQFNQPETILEFKPRGAQIFSDVTGENVGKRFAIVLDGRVRSAPVINERIPGGRASISSGTGDFQQAEQDARVLALVLRTGSLPAPVNLAETRKVGPSLGKDSITAGTEASMLGGVLVVLFMVAVYRKVGVTAVLALGTNVLLLLASLGVVGATLTLPGICGIALTVGMAVDANIIIYERIREELRVGRPVRAAVESGFENALSAILDSNITTAIAGVVLYSYGTGPVRGFAVTLLIGIATTLYTSIFVSRALVDLLVRRDNRLVF